MTVGYRFLGIQKNLEFRAAVGSHLGTRFLAARFLGTLGGNLDRRRFLLASGTGSSKSSNARVEMGTYRRPDDLFSRLARIPRFLGGITI